MFIHTKELQFQSKPDRPDPLMARRLQEVVGGQWGEMSVMNMYLFQGWNARGDEKYRDLLLDIGTEEIGHVEMLVTMIAQLLDKAPVNIQEDAYNSNPAIAAAMSGMDPQHAIFSGLGGTPRDSNGVPWSGAYITASGNLLADVRLNITAESQGRLQVARLYEMTEDKGVRDLLSFLLARDTFHQNLWIKLARELEEKNGIIVPSDATKYDTPGQGHVLYNFSEGEQSQAVVQGNAPDGQPFEYKSKPDVMGQKPKLNPGPKEMYLTKDAEELL